MSITAYATQADVTRIWSTFGVTARLDDDEDGEVNDSDEIDTMSELLKKTAGDMNAFLLQRYEVSVVAACSWAKWTNAVLAAVEIGRRRGNPVPEPLQTEAKRYMEELRDIRDLKSCLMADDGIATPRYDTTPAVSNLTVDSRYFRTKIRRIPATSSDTVRDADRKQYDTFDFYPY